MSELSDYELASKRKISDLLMIANRKDLYINGKGYYQKLIDLLDEAGYYYDNESILDKVNI